MGVRVQRDKAYNLLFQNLESYDAHNTKKKKKKDNLQTQKSVIFAVPPSLWLFGSVIRTHPLIFPSIIFMESLTS